MRRNERSEERVQLGEAEVRMRQTSKSTRRNKARRRGAVLVEYALLLTAFAIPAMAGIVAGGAAMLKDYQDAKSQLLQPFP